MIIYGLRNKKIVVLNIFSFSVILLVSLKKYLHSRQHISPHAIISNAHHYVKIGLTVLNDNAPLSLQRLVQQKRMALTEEHTKYPLFATTPTPPKDSILNDIMEEQLDVVDERDGKTFFLLDTRWDFLSASSAVPHIYVAKEVTDEFHTIPSPYTSPYFERLLLNETAPDYPKVSESYSCIRNLEGSYMTMEYLQTAYPDLVEVIDIGPTYLKVAGEGGHEMKILKITNKNSNATEKAPLFITCSLHAREAVPAEVCARFAEDIVKGYGENADKTWILDYTVIHMLMQGNPDGRADDEAQYAVLGRGYCRRKNLHQEKRCAFDDGSKFGVDLNRNFPHREWGTTGTGLKCRSSNAGPSKASEPETQNIVNYMDSEISGINIKVDGDFTNDATGLVLDLHSYGYFFVWPAVYSRTDDSSKERELRALAYKIDSFSEVDFSMANDFAISGSLLDWSHDRFGISAIAIEFGSVFYENCTAVEGSIVEEALNILLYGARVAWRPYIYPKGPDIFDIRLSSSTLMQNEALQVDLFISDSARVRNDYSTGGQAIDDLKVFIDSHPYENSSMPYNLTTNLTFNDLQEANFTLNINVSSLDEGGHILYLQGYDTGGPGPVYAEFFHVVSL